LAGGCKNVIIISSLLTERNEVGRAPTFVLWVGYERSGQ
jgi:hypothetical protein